MSLISSFNNFYSDLSYFGLFFFWIIIFLLFFLIFLAIILSVKNNKLKKIMMGKKEVIKENIPQVEESKLTPVKQVESEISLVKKEVDAQVMEENKEEIIKDTVENKETESGLYKKNILREMNMRMQTSPIHIERVNEDANIDTTGIDMGEDILSPLEELQDTYEVNDKMSFAEEISKRLEEEIKPSNIELTDYERKQEEEAIISYDELAKVKDKIYNITEDEENDDFIDELKSFRLDLQ